MKLIACLFLAASTLARSTVVPDVITVTNAASADAKREALVSAIWGPSGWPVGLTPAYAYTNWPYRSLDWAAFLTNYTGIARADVFLCQTPFRPPLSGVIRTYVYRFTPAVPNGDLFIYHAGHSLGGVMGDMFNSLQAAPEANIIAALLAEGYTVLGFSMPLYDGNPPPKIDGVTWDPVALHNTLGQVDPKPLRFFFEPLVVCLDWCQAGTAYHNTFMVGLSGGGWTTTWYSALDRRVKMSFPVAGSVPIWLRVGFEGLGDYEQTDDPVYASTINYSDLYVLATWKNRDQFQILNEFDDCCFWGTRHTNWVANVGWAAQQLSNGRYHFRLDSELHHHWFSPGTVRTIIGEARYFSFHH